MKRPSLDDAISCALVALLIAMVPMLLAVAFLLAIVTARSLT